MSGAKLAMWGRAVAPLLGLVLATPFEPCHASLARLAPPGAGAPCRFVADGGAPVARAGAVPGSSQASPSVAQMQATFASLPLRFEANVGQMDEAVRYVARASGATVFLTGQGATLALPAPAKGTVLTFKVAGGRAVEPRADDLLVTRSNYFKGNDPTRWRTNVASYGRVTYPGVLDGVDLVYHGDGSKLEYDFVVAPGVDASSVALEVSGADGLSLTEAGDLSIATPCGALVQPRPHVYQDVDGRRTDVRGGYRIVADDRVAFEVAEYDHARPLVIDPVISYATYLGGGAVANGGTDVGGIAVDAAGNVYVTGTTNSTTFPTHGAIDGSLNAGMSSPAYDAIVTELDAAGTAVVFSTYLGGSDADNAGTIALDGAGGIYLAGNTFSPDFPTKNPLQATLGNSGTAFVAELQAGGGALVYSTFLGSDLAGYSIAVDAAKNAYVAGLVNPGGTVPTVKALYSTPSATANLGYVAEIKAGGSALVYSTYLGGTNGDYVEGIAVDAAGDAYVVGSTNSTDFPVANALQPTLGGGSDAFVTEIAAGGQSLVYSTYLGGPNTDDGRAIAVDGAGNAYVGGNGDVGFPVTAGAYSGSGAGYMAKISGGSTHTLVYSALGTPLPSSIAVDASSNAYVVASYQGAVVVALGPDGSQLLFDVPLGSSGTYPQTVAVDAAGAIHISGYVNAATLTTTTGAFQSTYTAMYDGFVAKLTSTPLVASATPSSVGPLGTSTVSASGGSGTGYTFAFAASGNVSGGTITAAGAYKAGSTGGVTDTVQITDSQSETATTTITVEAALTLSPTAPKTYPGGTIDFVATGGTGGPYTWSLLSSGSGAAKLGAATGVYTAGATGSSTDSVQVKDGNGNVAQATVTVGAGMTIAVNGSTPVAPLGTVGLSGAGGDGGPYTWSVTTNNSTGAKVTTPGTTTTYTAGTKGATTDTVTAQDTHGNSATVQLAVGNGVTISPTDQSVAPRQSLTFSATGGSGTGYKFAYAAGGNLSGGTLTTAGVYAAGTTGSTTDSVVVTDSLGATASTQVNVGAEIAIADPAGATTPPRGALQLGVSGGYGAKGYTWSLSVDHSGTGSAITQSGAYTAGSTGSVSDTVTVVDTLGNTTSLAITVTAGVSLTPATPATLPPRAAQAFVAAGGSGSGYTWKLLQSPSGGTVDTSGHYKAGATGGVTDVVQASDPLGNAATASIAVGPGVTISPANATAAPKETAQLHATGGSGTYSWQVTTNASVGATVTATGATVTYTAGATANVADVVTATDSDGNTATVSISVGGGVSITPSAPTAPPHGPIAFSAIGGSGAGYAWTLTGSSGGTITTSGAYAAGPTGNTQDTVRVTDSAGNSATTTVTVTAGISVTPPSATVAPLGTATFAVTGGSGKGYSWSLQSGPSGGNVSSAGVYTAGAVGSVTDVAIVADSLGNTATESITVTAALALGPTAPSTPPGGPIAFAATGGAKPYTWSLATNGSGGNVNGATGAYTAGAVGNTTDAILVTDANGATATTPITVTGVLVIDPASPSAPPLGAIAFSATGGSGTGFVWSIAVDHSGGSIVATTGAYTAGSTGKVDDTVQVVDSLGNEATVSVSVGGGLAINPTNPSVAPKAAIAFAGTGGSGGYVWSLATSASGGTIDAGTGAYTAGSAGNVTDVVQVTDSSGLTATTSVHVGAAIVVSPATSMVKPGGSVAFAVQGGSGSGYVWALTTNASGGTIDATSGAYVAGTRGSVTDVVGVTDSAGNTASATVMVESATVPTADAGVDAAVDSGESPTPDAGTPGPDASYELEAGTLPDLEIPSANKPFCLCNFVGGGSDSSLAGGMGALLCAGLLARRRRARR